jgi:hypothetical protein
VWHSVAWGIHRGKSRLTGARWEGCWPSAAWAGCSTYRVEARVCGLAAGEGHGSSVDTGWCRLLLAWPAPWLHQPLCGAQRGCIRTPMGTTAPGMLQWCNWPLYFGMQGEGYAWAEVGVMVKLSRVSSLSQSARAAS